MSVTVDKTLPIFPVWLFVKSDVCAHMTLAHMPAVTMIAFVVILHSLVLGPNSCNWGYYCRSGWKGKVIRMETAIIGDNSQYSGLVGIFIVVDAAVVVVVVVSSFKVWSWPSEQDLQNGTLIKIKINHPQPLYSTFSFLLFVCLSACVSACVSLCLCLCLSLSLSLSLSHTHSHTHTHTHTH